MKIRKFIFLSTFVVSATAAAQSGPGGTWTLKDCIDYAMENNISLKKQQITRLSAVEDIKQSQKALLPSLSASTQQSVGWRPWINDGRTTVTNGTVANKISKTYYNQGPRPLAHRHRGMDHRDELRRMYVHGSLLRRVSRQEGCHARPYRGIEI